MSEGGSVNLFVCVVEEGSFSAASRVLGVAPSSVARQIQQLEQMLGARLFQRTTRKQSLTEAGELYYRHARRAAEELEAARSGIARMTGAPAGVLSLTAEPDLAVTLISPLLPGFLRRYPEVKVRLLLSSSLSDLVDGRIDLAVRMGQLKDSSLIARKLFDSRSQLCASPAYLEAFGRPAHPSDLSAHQCLSFRTSSGRTLWRFATPDGPCEVPVNGPVQANGLEFLKSLAMSGCGIALIPEWAARRELERGDLVALLSGFPSLPAGTPVSAVYAERRQLEPKTRAFVDFLAARLPAA
ncbi:LysR substrate-binding domain-containing protein [Leisingera sp. SS27]|uniref:LysR family transcriptional regulator n=1 Tax=Leisingera sp. SS27 TaxID=2979462 RepID=UPI00232C0958|nr:LysR family transcriptional regulator [Leisingera sp. SS27]MDC0660807.1 LysR substrate-binding domain-containing protein [Leisingera sp. SS27]